MHKIYSKISFSSKFLNFFLKIVNYKKKFINEKNTKKYIKKLDLKTRYKKYNLPKKLGFVLQKFDGMDVYSYNGTMDDNKKILLYIHGGSYIENAIYFQLKFAMKIAKKTNSTLIFPIYPLAPKNNYKLAYKLIKNLYNKIAKNNNKINMLGDSAGGGFILSFAMYLRDNGMVQPQNIIMLSPWLDISLSNPKMIEYEKNDLILGIAGNKYIGKIWKDELPYNDFLISPLYGNYNNLGKMTIVIGGSELLKPDIDIFKEKLNELKINYNYLEYYKQCHNFAIYPTKEAKYVINDIVSIIEQNI